MRILRVVSVAVVIAGSAFAGAWAPLRAQQKTRDVAWRGSAPLQAHVWWEPVTGVTFAVNEAAYVAVFDISPSDGIAQLYPAYPSEARQPVRAGLQRVIPAAAQTAYWAFQSNLGASYSGYWQGGPRYLLVIASRRPLRTSQYVGRPFALRTALGFNSYMAFRPYASMDALLTTVLPKPIGGDFSTSYYTLWPSQMQYYQTHNYRGQFVTMVCDGRDMVVPASFVMQAANLCGEQQLQQIANTRSRPDSTMHLRAPSMPGVAPASDATDRVSASKPQSVNGAVNGRPATSPAVSAQADLLRNPSRRAIERAYPRVQVRNYETPGRRWNPDGMPAGRAFQGRANNGARGRAVIPRAEGASRASSRAARASSPAPATAPRYTPPASSAPLAMPAPPPPPPPPPAPHKVHHGGGGGHV